MNISTSCFTAQYVKGTLRYIKSGDTEVLRMVYAAVRDSNWRTLTPKILKEEFENKDDGFQIKVRASYQEKDINFEAFFQITGQETRLEVEMDGEAKSGFLTNRVGFCILHPIKECAGKPCKVVHPDGTAENSIFPELISPFQPMQNISGLEWSPALGITAKLQFYGDVFEMEDQRNWTDASYKTYCRPLELPFPYQVSKNERIWQKFTLEIQGTPQQNPAGDNISFRIDDNLRFKIPETGVCSSSRAQPLEKSEAEILKQLPFKHLRSELKLFDENWKLNLHRVFEESVLLDLPLFLVLYFSKSYLNELSDLGTEIRTYALKVKYVLVVGKNNLCNSEIFNGTFQKLRELFPDAIIGEGVNAYFAELNRNRPQSGKAEFISFTVCPQVHAFDETTLVENLEGQKYVVGSAGNIFPEQPVFVSPVTLKQRFNVVATSEEDESLPDELPYQVDARQPTIFAAQWLMGSLKNLGQAGTDLVTYFETVGWCGFIQGNYNPPLAEKFPALKGDIFPVYDLLKEIAGYDGVVYSESSKPLVIEGIVLYKEPSGRGFDKILLANFTPVPQKVMFEANLQNFKIRNLYGKKTIHTDGRIIEISSSEIVVIETRE